MEYAAVVQRILEALMDIFHYCLRCMGMLHFLLVWIGLGVCFILWERLP